MAGILRIDPRPFSLRALVRMTEAARCWEWEHTSTIVCALANTAWGQKKTYKPRDFNPYPWPEQLHPMPLTPEQIAAEKAMIKAALGGVRRNGQ